MGDYGQSVAELKLGDLCLWGCSYAVYYQKFMSSWQIHLFL